MGNISVLKGEEFILFKDELSKIIKDVNERSLLQNDKDDLKIYATDTLERNTILIELNNIEQQISSTYDLSKYMVDINSLQVNTMILSTDDKLKFINGRLNLLKHKGINTDNELFQELNNYFKSNEIGSTNDKTVDLLINYKEVTEHKLGLINMAIEEITCFISNEESGNTLYQFNQDKVETALSKIRAVTSHYLKVINFLNWAIKLQVERVLNKKFSNYGSFELEPEFANELYILNHSIDKYEDIVQNLPKALVTDEFKILDMYVKISRSFQTIDEIIMSDEKFTGIIQYSDVESSYLFNFIKAEKSLVKEKASILINKLFTRAYGLEVVDVVSQKEFDVIEVIESISENKTLNLDELRASEKINSFSNETFWESVCLKVLRTYSESKISMNIQGLLLTNKSIEDAYDVIETQHFPSISEVKKRLKQTLSYLEELKAAFIVDIMADNLIGVTEENNIYKNLMSERIAIMTSLKSSLLSLEEEIAYKETLTKNQFEFAKSNVIKLPVQLKSNNHQTYQAK
ncbi:hypothetical protein MKY91_20295 [Alkalicoccobacillus gibsonii]|uniref:Uncharacterized protein n=1 Tax=Alkalicoccobacillus gibsonii TaxID=79881 RepID=A0ABU9VNT5_9BACI